MKTVFADPVEYGLPLGADTVPLNPLLGRRLSLEFSGRITCIACGRPTPKSFSQGHCYPCMQGLAACDLCIVKPELCHFAKGTCREPEWAQGHCFVEHTVYLANSSGLKVGITRSHQCLTRWMDQGAVQALPLLRTGNRLEAGLLEVALARIIPDKTDWRLMLRGSPAPLDLGAEAQRLSAHLPPGSPLPAEGGREAPVDIRFPVLEYPQKVGSLGFDKTPRIEGLLLGIKGQYLILDRGVLNIRKHAGYHVDLSSD